VPASAALRQHRAVRKISARARPPRLLWSILWSACGLNRVAGPFGFAGRTISPASASQQMNVYVALEAGAYRCDTQHHCLTPVVADDLRTGAMAPGQHHRPRFFPSFQCK